MSINPERLEELSTIIYDVNGEQVKLSINIVQDYITRGDFKITLQDFKLFAELCKVRKLNPFLNEAYLVKYSADKPAQIVVSKDVFLKRAILHPDYKGMEDGIIVINDNGEIKERRGCFKLSSDILVGGWAKVYRKNWDYPVYCSVSFEEAAQRKSNGNLNSMWSSKGATMINKVAKSRALREAFVDDLSGMIQEEEISPDYNTAPETIITQGEPIESPDVIDVDNIAQPEQVSMDDL